VFELNQVGNEVFFSANNGSTGPALWKTDGTTGGTQLVKDVDPGGTSPDILTPFGDKLLFVAHDGTHGEEVWVHDTGSGDTALLKDIDSGSADGAPDDAFGASDPFAVLDASTAVFRADNGPAGGQLWVTDGTTGGTNLVDGDLRPSHLTAIGDQAFFEAYDDTNGVELWVTDGTSGGTTMVADINPGSGSSDPRYFAAFGDQVLFLADDGTHGRELWSHDLSTGQTEMLKDINPSGSSVDLSHTAPHFSVVGDYAVFAADNGVNGRELWVTDGTTGGTNMLADINGGSGSSDPDDFVEFGDQVLFSADDGGSAGNELWTTDGTPDNTGLLTDINPSGSSGPDFYQDGIIGADPDATIIDADGVELWESAVGDYSLNDGGTTKTITDQNGRQVGADSFDGWSGVKIVDDPDGPGYRLLWEHTDGTYSDWTLDSSGHKTNGETFASGDASVFDRETVFGCDLNGDGIIGDDPDATIIESNGVELWESLAGDYSLNDAGTTKTITDANGDQVGDGTYAGWSGVKVVENPDGAGYRLLWEHTDGTYSDWTLDSSGQKTAGQTFE
jgi:ELWxxDGT repeat protein